MAQQYNLNIRTLTLQFAILPWVLGIKTQNSTGRDTLATQMHDSRAAAMTSATSTSAPDSTPGPNQGVTMWLGPLPLIPGPLPMSQHWREAASLYFRTVAPEILRSTGEILKTIANDRYGLGPTLNAVAEAFRKQGYLT